MKRWIGWLALPLLVSCTSSRAVDSDAALDGARIVSDGAVLSDRAVVAADRRGDSAYQPPNYCQDDLCPELCKAIDCSIHPLSSDDWDDDGAPNGGDNCPSLANMSQLDSDGDKIGDACDNCPKVVSKDQLDSDGDGHGDACDPDADNDGVPNGTDNCLLVANPNQGDANKDGQGDACDVDADGDGVLNLKDNCPMVSNPGQSNSDPNLYGDACDTDLDKDNIEDSKDNCPSVANVGQVDTDKDGVGDVCDPDRDGDGVQNNIDNCPLLSNPDQKDSDHDNLGDACDSHFCLVIDGDQTNCLDPATPLRVYASNLLVKTGSPVPLYLYSNRADTAMDYELHVLQGPAPGRWILFNDHGTCGGPKQGFLCTPSGAAPAGVVLDTPGVYKLRVTVNLKGPDPVNPNFPKSASFTFTLTAEGNTVCMPERCFAAP